MVTEADQHEAEAMLRKCDYYSKYSNLVRDLVASLLAERRIAREALESVSKRRIAHYGGEYGCDLYRVERPLHGTPGKCSCGADNARDAVKAALAQLAASGRGGT